MDKWEDPSAPLIDGNTVTCGNRTDLPKKQRVHTWVALGRDVRNGATRGFIEGIVSVCDQCGRDKFNRIKETTDNG
jgi:hypothetical protein